MGELIDNTEVRWAELDTGVEQATKVRFPILVWNVVYNLNSFWLILDLPMSFFFAKSRPIRVRAEPSTTAT